MLALALAIALAQTPQHRLFQQPNLPRDSFAFFEAFPSSGAGATGVCSSTAPTGAKGEVLTGTRGSADRCSSGATITSIAASSLVNLSNDITNVMPGGDGSSPLGVTVSAAGTNLILFPSTLNNVNWGITQNAGNPTVVNTNSTDPLGGNTASRVQFPATVGAQYSLLRQTGLTQPFSGSCYAKMVSGTGELCLFAGSGTGAVRTALNATTWTRMKQENSTQNGGLFVGTDSTDCSGGDFSAQDVYLWNCQLEATRAVTTPMDTTRAAQVLSAPVTLSGSYFSAAATWEAPGVFTSGATALQIYVDANNSITMSSGATGTLLCAVRIGGSTTTTTSVATMVAGSRNRVACYYDGTSTGACVNGVCTLTAGAITMFTGAATFYLGTRSATGNEANSTLKEFCYDPAAERCRRSL